MENYLVESKLTEKELAILYGELNNSKKSSATAYLLWFFLGGIGIHRFYLASPGIAWLIIVSQIFGFITIFFFAPLSFLCWFVVASILLIDLFTIPSQITQMQEKKKAQIINRLMSARPESAA